MNKLINGVDDDIDQAIFDFLRDNETADYFAYKRGNPNTRVTFPEFMRRRKRLEEKGLLLFRPEPPKAVIKKPNEEPSLFNDTQPKESVSDMQKSMSQIAREALAKSPDLKYSEFKKSNPSISRNVFQAAKHRLKTSGKTAGEGGHTSVTRRQAPDATKVLAQYKVLHVLPLTGIDASSKEVVAQNLLDALRSALGATDLEAVETVKPSQIEFRQKF